MSFTGDLAQLPIVDVIQLIHSSRKSGTLTIEGRKGRCLLSFCDGYFVSANHLNNSVRIGQILVESGFLTTEVLDKALLEQKLAGNARKPLISILIEQGRLKREDAYSGLESLIEMTIVEALTWTSGTFSMDLNYTDISDEYRYFPETLQQEVLLNAQQILMDALRIYDEKMRDGGLENIFFNDDAAEEEAAGGADDTQQAVTADMLGLDVLDTIPTKGPVKFARLEDKDDAEEHRLVIADELRSLPRENQEELITFLTGISKGASRGGYGTPAGTPSLAVIMFSHDSFMKYALSTICKSRNYIVFTTDDDISLDLFIDQSFAREHVPVLVVDDPVYIGEGYEERTAAMLKEKREKYPLLSILQLSSVLDNQALQTHVLEEGSEVILPRPVWGGCPDTFVTGMIEFLQVFHSVLEKSFIQPERQAARRLKEGVAALTALSEPPQVARELLSFIAGYFERAVTLVIGTSELTAERGIGISADKSSGPTGPLLFKIPLGQASVFDRVIENRHMFYGLCSDPVLSDHLHAAIHPPRSSKVLLLPLVMADKVLALIYADFGQMIPSPVLIEHIEIFSRVAGLVLDNSYYVKKFELISPRRQTSSR